MQESSAAVDHSTLNRWVIKYALDIEKQFHRRRRPVGKSWRLDQTYHPCQRQRFCQVVSKEANWSSWEPPQS